MYQDRERDRNVELIGVQGRLSDPTIELLDRESGVSNLRGVGRKTVK